MESDRNHSAFTDRTKQAVKRNVKTQLKNIWIKIINLKLSGKLIISPKS
jgi:hypothetical protein